MKSAGIFYERKNKKTYLDEYVLRDKTSSR
jgi:hypothetical protein